MSREDPEQEVHDYLDGRLGEEERRSFESRLAREPALARRLEAYRSIRRELRESPPELPPGFYARARARFEKEHPPRRGWARLVSWEVTGLAAAAVLLTALLLPALLPERPGPDGGDAAPRSSGPPPAAPSPAVGPSTAAPPREELERGSHRDEAPPVALPEEPAGAESEQVAEREVPAPPPPPRAADQSVESGRARDFGAAPRLSKQEIAPDREAGGSPPPRLARLPEGVQIEGWRVIEDPDSWRSFLAGLPPGTTTPLRPDFLLDRVVLVGAGIRDIDCDSIDWTESEGKVVIHLPAPTSARVGAAAGCAVVIPAGPWPVELVLASGGSRER